MNAKRKALVVDDTELHRNLIKLSLVSRNYAVTVAMDGREGLEACRETTFDLVFSDFEMPNMNGAEFLRAVKRLPGYNRVPVVILSTLTDPALIQRVMNFGAFHYIVKPFTTSKLDELFAKLA